MNKAGVDLLKHFEGCKLETYRDSIGVYTIGYGHTEGVHSLMVWTQEQADKQLEADIERFEAGVRGLLKTPVTENQLAALVCFAFNVGLGNFKRSTLLNCINKGNYNVGSEFLRWDKAGGRVLAGLTKRRQAEAALFSL